MNALTAFTAGVAAIFLMVLAAYAWHLKRKDRAIRAKFEMSRLVHEIGMKVINGEISADSPVATVLLPAAREAYARGESLTLLGMARLMMGLIRSAQVVCGSPQNPEAAIERLSKGRDSAYFERFVEKMTLVIIARYRLRLVVVAMMAVLCMKCGSWIRAKWCAVKPLLEVFSDPRFKGGKSFNPAH